MRSFSLEVLIKVHYVYNLYQCQTENIIPFYAQRGGGGGRINGIEFFGFLKKVCSDGNNLIKRYSFTNILIKVSSILFKSVIFHTRDFKLNNRITRFNIAHFKSNDYGMSF